LRPTIAEVEEASMWLSGDADVFGANEPVKGNASHIMNRRSPIVQSHRSTPMKLIPLFVSALAVGWLMLLVGITTAQERDIGKIEYQSNCAACHGPGGKGDGPMKDELRRLPTDLTVLAKKNNGIFPLNSVYRIIDGRDAIASHGSREMPVWGYRFVPPKHFDLKLADDYIYSPAESAEPIVHARILAVIDYLNRIQAR
jgi:hypothetical protein